MAQILKQIDWIVVDQLVADGWITERKHPSLDLWILNYTAKCQYERHWTPETIQMRGLIVDQQGVVVARPFPKFFNYGEEMPMSNASIVEATAKLDGSLGILHWDGNLPSIATRGSFESEQAIWATEWIRRQAIRLDKRDLKDLTLLFEIVYPENRVVIDYHGEHRLFLIGGMGISDGRDLLWDGLSVIAKHYMLAQPYVWTERDINSYLALATQLTADHEGWVVRYDDGTRFKVKTDAYKLAHKMLTEISFKRVLEAEATGVLEDWIETVPDEFLTQVKAYRTEIQNTVIATLARINDEYDLSPYDSDRKTFAKWVMRLYPNDSHYLFARYDNKQLLPLIYRREFDNRQG